jgi:hypothetical protein
MSQALMTRNPVSQTTRTRLAKNELTVGCLQPT